MNTSEIEERRELLIRSLEQLPVALMVFRSIRDDAGAIVDFEWLYTNPAAAEFVQREDAELRGKRLLEEMPENRVSLFERYVEVVETGKTDIHEFRYQREGQRVWISNWSARVGDGFVVTFTETTSRHLLRLKSSHQAGILKGMHEQSPFAACVVSGDEPVFEFANEAFEELVDEGELVGKSLATSLNGREPAPALKTILEQVHGTWQALSVPEYQLDESSADGSPRYLRIVAQPLEEEAAPSRTVQLVAVDISALVESRVRAEDLAWQLAEEEEQYRATVSDAPVGIAQLSLQGGFHRVNERLVRIFGYSESELLTRCLDDLNHPEEEAVNSRLDELSRRQNSGRRIERKCLRKDGTTLWTTLTVSLLRDRNGLPRHYIAIVEDVSDLMDAKRRLEDSNRHKDEFLAMLGHELSNPLAALRNAASLLASEQMEPEQFRTVVSAVQRQTKHMSRLVGDLLDIGRVSRGKLRFRKEPTNFVAVVQGALDDLQASHQPAQEFRVELPEQALWVEADTARLLQACQNLLTNAVKYTPSEGRIRVDLGAEGGNAVLRVQDTGVGLHEAFIERLFKPFEQEPQDFSRSQGGLGLGLTLTAQIVESHGGSIQAESSGRGQGSTFTLRIPLGEEPEGLSPSQVPASNGPLRFLIVEDNHDAAELLELLLKNKGHETQTCFSGDAALRCALDFVPQVVLCDLGLPGLSGFEVAGALRESALGQEVILLAISGYSRAQDVEQSLNAGFDGHLGKPVDVDKILKNVARLRARRDF